MKEKPAYRKRPAPPLTPKRVAQNRAGYEKRKHQKRRAAELNGWGAMEEIVTYIINEAEQGRAVLPNPNGGTK